MEIQHLNGIICAMKHIRLLYIHWKHSISCSYLSGSVKEWAWCLENSSIRDAPVRVDNVCLLSPFRQFSEAPCLGRTDPSVHFANLWRWKLLVSCWLWIMTTHLCVRGIDKVETRTRTRTKVLPNAITKQRESAIIMLTMKRSARHRDCQRYTGSDTRRRCDQQEKSSYLYSRVPCGRGIFFASSLCKGIQWRR